MGLHLRSRGRLLALAGVVAGAAAIVPAQGLAAPGGPRVIAGYRDAEVAFGSSGATVAQLPLPAGRWWVIAKARLFLPSSAVGSCQLVASSGSQYPSGAYAFTSVDLRRLVFVTMLMDMEFDGSARLDCIDSSASGAQASWVKMVAVKLGRYRHRVLPRGRISASGDSGVRLEMASRGGPLDIPGGWKRVGVVPLAAGRWWTVGHLDIEQSFLNGSARPECRLRAGAREASTRDRLGASDGTSTNMALQEAVRLDSPGGVEVACRRSGQDASATHLSIGALRVGRLVSGTLGGRFSASGQGTPEVRAGSRRRSVVVPDSGSFVRLGRLPLPAGRWAVVATASVALSSGAASDAMLYCRLTAGSDFDRAYDLQLSATLSSRLAPLAGMVVHEFGTRGHAVLSCRAVGAAVEVSSIRLAALRAGHLTNQDISPP